MTQSVIGVDFDNTIVCYDDLFHKVALEKELIPSTVNKTKESVRDYLRQINKEDQWTELQGYVYGVRMNEATPYPGVIEFFRSITEKNIPIYVISHKTLYPYAGPKYNLHQSAWGWLEHNGFFDPKIIGLNKENVFFEKSIDEKIQRISDCQCTHFIDDLLHLFEKANFPATAEKILFDPNDGHLHLEQPFKNYNNWQAIGSYLI